MKIQDAELIPICSSCGQVRDKEGNWHTADLCIGEPGQAVLTHGLCPACLRKLYPEQYRDLTRQGLLRYVKKPPEDE